MTGPVFLWGTLCHPPLLRAVLGEDAGARPDVLPGWLVMGVSGCDGAVLVPRQGGVAEGLTVSLGAEARARLDFYAAAVGLRAQVVGGVTVHVPVAPRADGGDWSLEGWQARWGVLAEATSRDVMALYGRKAPEAVLRRRAVMLVRGAARARAEMLVPPATLRRQAQPQDVALADRREPYADFFAVEEYDLSFRRFDGGMSGQIGRTAFVSGDAVVVLPYDPRLDRVLLVEQFRVGAYARGDANPWSLEGIAGRVDPGETPEESGRREAVEEAGVVLGAMLPVHHHYPSPGAKTEFLYTYVALCDLGDDSQRHGGLPGEGEDIRGHVIGFDRLMELVDSGEVNNGPLTILALWLQRERARLRGR